MRKKSTSFPGSLFSVSLVVEKRDPGCGWSSGSQNLGAFPNVCYGRGGSVGLVIIRHAFDFKFVARLPSKLVTARYFMYYTFRKRQKVAV